MSPRPWGMPPAARGIRSASPRPAGGHADHTWEARIRKLTRLDLLILDDFGLREFTPQGGDDFFELVSERHKTGSMILTSARAPTRPTRHKEVAQARTAPVGVSDSLIDPLMNSLIVHRPPGQRHRAGSWSATAAGSGSPRAAPYRCRPRTGDVALMGEYARTVAAGSRTTTGVRRPMTSHRTKQPTPAGKAEWGLLGARGARSRSPRIAAALGVRRDEPEAQRQTLERARTAQEPRTATRALEWQAAALARNWEAGDRAGLGTGWRHGTTSRA